MLFLSTHSIWYAVIVLLLPTTLAATAGPLVVRRFVTLERLRTNNEVAGFKFATIGVIYAVLLAFAVIVVWEKFNLAESGVAKEATAAVTIVRLSQGIDPDHGAAVRKATIDYVTTTIARDWPAMEQGRLSAASTEALGKVYGAVLKFHDFGANEGLVVAEILRQVDRLSEARRERLVAADGTVPGIIWMVLFVGAFLTVGFTFFFGTENVHAQALMTGALAFLIFTGLLTIVAIDHPFAGTFRVGPEALAGVVADFSSSAAR
jgi:hypothetical protein